MYVAAVTLNAFFAVPSLFIDTSTSCCPERMGVRPVTLNCPLASVACASAGRLAKPSPFVNSTLRPGTVSLLRVRVKVTSCCSCWFRAVLSAVST